MAALITILWDILQLILAGIGITMAIYMLAALVIACFEKIKEEVQKHDWDD